MYLLVVETQAYVLNFHGRVTEASVKNFQLVHSTDGESARILMRYIIMLCVYYNYRGLCDHAVR